MNIAIICDKEKTKLAINFCKINKNILKYNKIYIPQNLKEAVENEIEFNLVEILYCYETAKEQVLSRIFYGEIQMLIFFRDSKKNDEGKEIDSALINICDEMCLPFATNLKTAEILIKNLN